MGSNYEELEAAYDPDRRVGQCAEDDALDLRAIEIGFAISTVVTQDQYRRLRELLAEIVRAPYNQPEGGVYWLSSEGSRMRMSASDAAFLGAVGDTGGVVDPNIKPGEEPTYEDDVLCFGTCARSFMTVRERDRVLVERKEGKRG